MSQTIKIKINVDSHRIQGILSREEYYKLEYIQHFIDWKYETCIEVMRVLENEMMIYFTTNKDGEEAMKYMTALYLLAEKQKMLLEQAERDKKLIEQMKKR